MDFEQLDLVEAEPEPALSESDADGGGASGGRRPTAGALLLPPPFHAAAADVARESSAHACQCEANRTPRGARACVQAAHQRQSVPPPR
jgi:hypothetical protein